MKNLVSFVLAFAILSVAFADVGYQISSVDSFKALRASNDSTLYEAQLEIPTAYGSWPVYLIDLHGSRFQMGYDYGVLLGKEIQTCWNYMQNSIISMSGGHWYDIGVMAALTAALDWQWSDFLSKGIPEEYQQEIQGIKIGCQDAGVADCDVLVTRVLVLANLPGDPGDMIFVLINEWNSTRAHEMESSNEVYQKVFAKQIEHKKRSGAVPQPVKGLQCSMFGAWGGRTIDGSLFSARNLDWNKDTGMQQYKLVTVYHPNDGTYAHATLGFAGMIGALTGMSAEGITVHEANLEEVQVNFGGFAWVMRLRYIMENAGNLNSAKALWDTTGNTVGFNHMVGSAFDGKSLVMETRGDYTAFFFDMDPREQTATYTDPTTGNVTQIGYPLPNAVYRTNHGYDPKIRAEFEWSQAPTSWSMQRYMFMYEAFSSYEQQQILIDEPQAINITAIVADKGPTPYQCQAAPSPGSNVLSVTYHPSQARMYAAWESGTGATWKPACCSTYVRLDMAQWWQSK